MKKYYSYKNHSQRESGPSLSEILSSDVTHPILSRPTDTLQALDESLKSYDDANVLNYTQSAKNNILKFLNGDFKISYNEQFSQIRRLLSMKLEGRSDYVVYKTPRGRLAFRLTDHNAQGDNFRQDNADMNISVYISYNTFKPNESKVDFIEYAFDDEYFDNNRQLCINVIINAVYQAIITGVFEIDSSVATKIVHPTPEDIQRANEKEKKQQEQRRNTNKDNHENSNYNNIIMRNNSKALYESIMKDVAKIVKRHLNENSDIYYDNIDDFIDEFIDQLCTPYAKFKTDISSNWGRYDNRYQKIQDKIYRVIIRVTDDADTHLILRTSFVINLSDNTFSDIDVEITDNPEDYNDRLERILTHNLYRDVSELLDYMVFKTA